MSDEQSTHSLLAPSAAHRWIPCPGSTLLHESTDSDAAAEGQTAHGLGAYALALEISAAHALERLQAIDKIKPGGALELGVDFQYVDEDMLRYVDGYCNFVRSQVPEDAELYIEQRVHFHEEIGVEDPQGGTGDAIIVYDGGCTTIDLKYGRSPNGKVFAERNPQLLLYSLGARREFGHLTDLKKYKMIIYQPRLDHIDEWECTDSELTKFAKSAGTSATVVLKCQTEWSTLSTDELFKRNLLVAGDKQCRWCRAKATCPAYAKMVEDVTGADFDDLTQTDLPPVREITPGVDTTAVADVLSVAMSKVDMIEHWCKAVRAATEKALLEGVSIDGWKLVQGRQGPRKWKDPEPVEALFKSKFRLKVEEMYDMEIISPTSAEKILKDQPRRWSQVLPHIVRAEGGLSVAPEADKRPAVDVKTLNASTDDFDDLTVELLPADAATVEDFL